MCDGERVGGAIVKVEVDRGELEILFVSPRVHSKGVGYAAWCEIERMYPQVRVWGLVTPYFETRNIHFYVNRCGFHIVEFFNSLHPDPNDPDMVDFQGGRAVPGGYVPVREADVVGRGAAWALLGASVAWFSGLAI